MAFYIGRKILGLIVVLIGVTILSFIFSNISPVDPAQAYVMKNIPNPTQEQIEAVREELGLNLPIYEQYYNWLINCLKGDFGKSLTTRNYVIEDIFKKLPATLLIVGMAMLWIVLITFPVALICAIKKDNVLDHAVRIVSIIGVSIPSFWLGFLLLLAFAVFIPIFVVVDFGSLRSLILPSLTIAVPVICSLTRMLRSTILSNLNQDYVLYAKARGLSNSTIMFKYVLKNSLPPVITALCQSFGYMIAGSAIVESVFSWPGLGSHLVNAIFGRDLPTINGAVLILAVIFVICNLFADLVNNLINPRISI